jgi:excinuclease ABC subunit A
MPHSVSSSASNICVRGARQHNLQDVDLDVPKHRLVVMTGPSGSGKSSLAFDTLFAEGQRRYVQSLSAYARQFLDQIEKPDVDRIDSLPPALAIEQKGTSSSPRSTVATGTEIYDYVRVLFASFGQPHHPKTGKPLQRMTTQQIVDRIMDEPAADRFLLLAPLVRQETGAFPDVFEKLQRDGFVRVRVDGDILMLEEKIRLDRKKAHTIEVVVDRLSHNEEIRSRLADSVELGLRLGEGLIQIHWLSDPPVEWTMSNQNFDAESGYRIPKFTPAHFSFNSPLGARTHCHGLGREQVVDPGLLVPDDNVSLEEGVIAPWAKSPQRIRGHYRSILRDLARARKLDPRTPWKDLPTEFRDLVLFGSQGEPITFTHVRNGQTHTREKPFEGAVALIQELFDSSKSLPTRRRLTPFMSSQPCRRCEGRRLRPVVLAVTLTSGSNSLGIHEFVGLTISQALDFLEKARLPDAADELLREIINRLHFLDQVGLGYLTLDRPTATLSGGESQRIRLATQIGSGLTGVLYVLDEPSIGLHQRDNARLIETLVALRDQGNSVVVVEHDEDTIRAADHVFDLGPGAGRKGGRLVASGTPEEIENNPNSPTGLYLRGDMHLTVPRSRQKPRQGYLTIEGARANNLQNIHVKIPVGCFTCVTGVSGSGKSTLINDILSRALFRHFYKSKERPAEHDTIRGFDLIDKVITIDQSPIGRTPRSNPATYSGAFNVIRDLFAQLPAARIRGYKKSRFSFNTAGGRCEHCQGDGSIKIEMHLLPDVFVVCEQCGGKRFNRETLEITYRGNSIADVLTMTVDDALAFFASHPGVVDKLSPLAQVGLGYVQLGQSATTLSGGEAQRVKLAAELGKKNTGRTCFILDEPTTGLHFRDVEQLLSVLFQLRNAGNTIIVIEHHLDVIKSADHLIDLGPEGGSGGGRVVAEGTPEELVKNAIGHTAHFLQQKLGDKAPRATTTPSHEPTLF